MNLRKNLQRYINLYNYVEAYKSNRLPSDYTRLDYIESTGTQYIDTGYALTTDNFEISGSGLKRQDTASVFFGARNTTSPYIGILEARTSSGLLSFWTGVAWAYFVASTNEKYDFKFACTPELACTVSCSGFTDKTFTATQTYVNGMNINLFGNNPFASMNSSVVLYAFSIKDNGVLVRNFIPVKRNSDNELGMYDLVSGTFFTNSGTGEFIAGPEISKSSVVLTDAICNGLTDLQLKGSEVKNQPETFLNSVIAKGKTELRLPVERYDVLEYLETTGTQYIDTGVVVNSNTYIKAEFVIKKDISTGGAIFGARPTGSVGGGVQLGHQADAKIVMDWLSGTRFISPETFQKDIPYVAEVSNRVFTIKNANTGTIVTTNTFSDGVSVDYTLALLGLNNGGTFIPSPDFIQLKSLIIKNSNNAFVRNMIPAKNSSGVIGMYDLVSKQFFTNQGTGDFIAGAVIDTFSVYLPEEYTLLDYIQSSGAQYIDLGRVPNNNDIVEQKFQKLGTSTTTCSWYGSMPSSSTIIPRIGIGSFSNQSVATVFAGSNYTGMISAVDTNVHTLRFQATGEKELTYTFDGVTSVIEATPATNMFEPVVELTSYLFARHGTNGVQVYDNEGTKIYYHREYLADGTLVLNVIPVRRNSDNVLGMYDIVSGQFFTNQGTGDFIAGPEIVPTLTTPVDIWCNNGVLKPSYNEFDVNAIINGYFYNADLEWVANSSVYITDYMKTVKGKYTLVLDNVTTLSATVNIRVNLFNANKEIQSQVVIPITADTTEYTYEVDIPDGISYVRISTNPIYVVVSSFSNSNSVYADGIVETIEDTIGNTATTEMLLKVSDYQDTQSMLDGTITRNVGVLVLDGTENWTAGTGQYTGNCYCDNLLPNLKRPIEGDSPAICTVFPMVERISDFSVGKGYVSSNPAGRVNLWYNDTVVNFKQYLADQYAAGHPIIVVYPLATATIETVSLQKLLKNPVTVTEASIDNLEVTTTEIEHTIPTPDYPLDIVCNNGILKVGPNLFNADSSNITIGYWINNNTGEEQANTSNFMINGYIPVKSNTSYVAYGKRKTDNYLSQWNRIAWYDSDKNYISTSPYAQRTIGLGTSPSNAAYARFSSNPTASTVTQDTVDSFNWTFREGTQEYTKFIPYNGVIVEGTPETVTITGKNLFDKNGNLKTGTYRVDNGAWVDNAQFKTLDYIPGKPGVSYTLSAQSTSETGGNAFSVQAWDSTHTNWLGTIASTTAQNIQYASGISPAGTAYLSVSFAPSYRDINTLQLEECSRPTQYEEYYQVFFAPEDLLKLSDYQDVQDVINGIKSKKIGFKILDGTEDWIKTPQYSNLYELSIKSDMALSGNIMFALTSTHLIGTAEVNANMPDNSIKLTTRGVDRTDPLMFIKTSQGNDTLAGFKQFLADQYTLGTPVIVVYPLADTVEETVESRDVFITSGTNTIERNGEYVSSGDIIVGYKKLR